MLSPDGARPYGYSGDATARSSAIGGGGVDANAATDAMPAVRTAGRSPQPRRGVRAALIGTGLAVVLTGAYALGQLRGPDNASASGPGGGTPTPGLTETPGATSTPGSSDHELQPGQCIDLQASGDQIIIVQGDTTINGTNIFDNDAQTAAMAKLVNGDYDICAPFGADVQQTTKPVADNILGSDAEQALDKGFRSVTIFKFDGGHMVQGSRN